MPRQRENTAGLGWAGLGKVGWVMVWQGWTGGQAGRDSCPFILGIGRGAGCTSHKPYLYIPKELGWALSDPGGTVA